MRSHVVPAIVLTTLALTATSLAGTAGAEPPEPVPIHQGVAGTVVVPDAPAGTVCARNNGVPNGDGINAQHWEHVYRAYNVRAAADLTPRRRCIVSSVDITGLFLGDDGPSSSVEIQIRKDAAGLPGRTSCAATLSAPGPSFTVPVVDCTLRKDRTYWLAVQVDQNYHPNGQWFWATTDERMGLNDAWKNRRNGLGTGCRDWDTIDNCRGFAWDLLFSVNRS